MKTEKIHFKEVSFPHLRAKVKFFDLSKLKGVPIMGSGYTMIMSKDENHNIEVGVFLENIAENVKKVECMPYILHEIVHALQYICEELGIDMAEEKESVAYMAHWLVVNVLGLEEASHN